MSKLKAGHKVRKQRTESTPSDPEWFPGILAMWGDSHDFLASHGYSTDEQGLEALMFMDSEPPPSSDGGTSAPPAEIVAAARAHHAACAVIYCIASDEPNLAVSMFLLGEDFFQFEMLRLTPGLDADVAIRPRGVAGIFDAAIRQVLKDGRRRRKANEGIRTYLNNRMAALKPRNDALCAIALTLRSEGVKDLHLATRVLHHFIKKGLWDDFPEEQRLTTSKQVLTILRLGNIVSSAKKKKIGK